jgi:hypothetical protein
MSVTFFYSVVIQYIVRTIVKTVCFTGDTMRFGIHNLLREKVEEFSDDEENIEVEETDIEDHEEEEEEEDDEGMEEEKRGKAHIAPELTETKKNFKQEEVRNYILEDGSVRNYILKDGSARCFLTIPSYPIPSTLNKRNPGFPSNKFTRTAGLKSGSNAQSISPVPLSMRA